MSGQNIAALRGTTATGMAQWRFIDLRDVPVLDESHLSPDERARYLAFRVMDAAHRWARARLALRDILSHVAGQPPKALTFVTGSEGKPALADASLEFSLSHSGNWACIAWSHVHCVGVDIEDTDHARPSPQLARMIMCDEELAYLETLPPAQRQATMLRFWTRKEAVLKASGMGLQRKSAMRQLCALQDEMLAPADAEGSRLAQWQICDLEAPAGVVASLAWPQTPYSRKA